MFSPSQIGDFFHRIQRAPELAQRALVDGGVAGERLAMQDLSRNTCKSARETASALGRQAQGTWILMTSASHMPRAVACFRTTDLAVLPYPVDYRVGSAGVYWPGTASSGLAATDLAPMNGLDGSVTDWQASLTFCFPGQEIVDLYGP